MRLTLLFLCALLTGAPSLADAGPVVIASDGSAEFKSVQAAVDSIPEKADQERVILIKPGTYKERIAIGRNKPHITLRGDGNDSAKVVLTFDRHAGMDDPLAPGRKVGTGNSETVLIAGDDFTAENVTFENSSGDVGQAVAVRTIGDRAIFRNCRFLAWQDTLYVDGARAHFDRCYVEGRVDFIFGRSTAVFDRCQIRSKNGGYVTAASTPEDRPYGLVFLDCKLTGEGNPAYLGRPWHPFAATAFLRCEISPHVRLEGWSIWRGNENHKTARYVEFANTGPGADPSKHPEWVKRLTRDEAEQYTIPNVIGGKDHWDPRRR